MVTGVIALDNRTSFALMPAARRPLRCVVVLCQLIGRPIQAKNDFVRNRIIRNRSNRLSLVPPLHRATHAVGLFLFSLRLGMSQGEAHVLAHIETEGPSTIAALHAAFGHRRSTLTSILDRLAAANLIRRQTHVEDRRTFLISLTAQGRALAGRIFRELAVLEGRVMERVGAAELAGFNAVVEALQKAARVNDKEGNSA